MQLNEIIDHANESFKQAPLNNRLVDIYQGNLIQYVKAAMKNEISDPTSFALASTRIPSINLIEKITDKLSKVYSDKPKRTVPDVRDQETLDLYMESIDINSVMSNAEILLNLNKNFALEPYIEDGLFKVRVLASSEFAVYSDDMVNPHKPTAIIKFMGSVEGKDGSVANRYWVYSQEEWIDCTSQGEVLNRADNPYGVIPIIYCNMDSFSLQPKPDLDMFENALIVPKLLADLNYSVQFMTRSTTYTIDVDMQKNPTSAPDVIWNLKTDSDNPNSKPQVGVISPTVDVEKVLALLNFTVAGWLDSKGIKTSAAGNLTNTDPASAVSKLVDEADASSLVGSNRILLTKTEQSLWRLIGLMHNTMLDTEKLLVNVGVNSPFNVSISFPIQKPIIDPQEQRDTLKFKLDNKLISYDRALREANPDLSDEEIQKLKLEIQAESQAAPAQPLEAVPSQKA